MARTVGRAENSDAPSLRLATPAAVDVFTRILTHGPISRADITRQTGLSPAAVTNAVAPLIDAGFVTDDAPARASEARGRPAQPLRIAPESMLALGIKVDVHRIIGVVTMMDLSVVHAEHRPLADTGTITVVEQVTRVVEDLLAKLGADTRKVVGIGISVSGDVDSEQGLVRQSPRLGWTGVPLAELLQSRLGRPVLIEDEVRGLTIGEELFGAGVDVDSFAILTIGAGIGSGFYINGDVVSGAMGVTGQIGHVPLGPLGRICQCGRRGCVETIASTPAILAAIREGRGDPELTLDQAVRLARAGDPIARDAFDRAGRILGMAVATMVNLVGPELVLVMGEAAPDFDLYEIQLRKSLAESAFGPAGGCRIVVRPHSINEWASGAAASVIRRVVRQEFPPGS